MVLELEDAVDIYRECSTFPSVTSGRICNAQAPGHVRVYTSWSQRDLEKGELVKFGRGHIVQLDIVFPTPATNIASEQWNVESPSGKMRAIVRKGTSKKGEEKQFIEIWTDSRMQQCIDVDSLDVHGKIYENGEFGCLEWSHSETHLLFVAEKKVATSKSYFDRKAMKDLEEGKPDVVLGDEYLYKETWGEQMGSKVQSVLCVFDIEAGAVSVLENIPDDVSPGQAVWCPDDLGIVCVGWSHEPYHLGIIYCPMRKSVLFCPTLGSIDQSVRSPLFSPDQKKLLFLENPVGGPHFRCSELKMIDWSTKGVVTAVPIVHSAKDDEFQGLFNLRLPKRCMASDSQRLILTAQWRSQSALIVVDVETGEVRRMTNDPQFGSWQFLDVNNNLILAVRSSPSRPQHLVMGSLPEAGQEDTIKWTPLDDEQEEVKEIDWKILSIDVPAERRHPQFGDLSYECILLQSKEKSSDGKKRPLIVFPHGGPNSVFTADFALYNACFVRCGFSLLMVNYRGSAGFTQNGIDSLIGRVGDQDVKDCQGAAEKVIEMGLADRDRVLVMGGSHGGFLTCHLIGQYPDFYKAAVARNPVINMTSMFGSTDIPDWTYTQIGLTFDFKSNPDADIYAELYNRSPIRYVDQVKTPLMLAIGAKDQRVPPKQAHEMRKALQARGVQVRALCYSECEHPISEVKSEADCFINMLKWFNEHLP
ncbi:hypothetical protein CAPTEDRAFT_154305 [Capitella teleta]|uniref:Acylamino-acid-releasing enzyme n=1 Tax=Capitella teleta TaxID=283909 RepID=R7UFJ3_CAPTE|nr:hypothetical protein CAPTEDRAFT_154305 [Capitella teleta]|eukprot:ELU02553.1 hypothetical protein CAPTEDRAFT_154305 [Capitella teleta]